MWHEVPSPVHCQHFQAVNWQKVTQLHLEFWPQTSQIWLRLTGQIFHLVLPPAVSLLSHIISLKTTLTLWTFASVDGRHPCSLLHVWCRQTRSPTRRDAWAAREAAVCTKLGRGLGDTLPTAREGPERARVYLSTQPRGLTCEPSSRRHHSSLPTRQQHFGTHLHVRRVRTRVSAGGCLRKRAAFSLLLQLGYRYRRALPIPEDGAQEGAGDFYGVSCTTARFVPRLARFDWAFASSSHEGHAWRNSRGISSCRNCCHIPKVPWLLTLRSGLFSCSAPPGSRRAGGRCDWIRALQRCMRGTDGQIPGFTCHGKTKCVLSKTQNTRSARLKGCIA